MSGKIGIEGYDYTRGHAGHPDQKKGLRTDQRVNLAATLLVEEVGPGDLVPPGSRQSINAERAYANQYANQVALQIR